jgi:tRNA A-37 threonylcarbamoyl transferase component Bud32
MSESVFTWAFLLALLCLVGLLLLVGAVVLTVVLAGALPTAWGGPRRGPAAPHPSPPPGKPQEHRPLPSRRTDHAAAREGHCPECGIELPPDSPRGLCPQCLLKRGLDSSPGPPEEGPARTTPYPGSFQAPAPADLAVHFPQLEILELIGQGGMGAVYKARQTKLERLVALKVLPPEWGRDPAFAERFAREARAMARLSHPHIVTIYEFGETGGLYYLVMEFVDGLNLRQLLRGGRLQPQEALTLVPQICEALQYAHEEGIVHRDIKPENVLLDRKGRVKIADFGLAKLLGGARAEFTLTGSQQVMGTLDYMAPEQRQRPLETDHRADIYSLGVLFYEMLTGELPLGRFAPPSEKAPVDARLDEVVLRALESDPERRYQHASDVKTDVESIARGAGPEPAAAAGAGEASSVEWAESRPRPWAAAAPPRRSGPWVLVVLLVAALLVLPATCLVLGAGGMFYMLLVPRSAGSPQPDAVEFPQPHGEVVPHPPEPGRAMQTVERRAEAGGPDLLEAARGGDRDAVLALLGQGASARWADGDGYSALMAAAENGHLPVVQVLLDRGADVNARDRKGKTALDYAAAGGHQDVVAALRARGAVGPP